MFDFSFLERPELVSAAKVGEALAASLEFPKEFQLIAGIGASDFQNDRMPVIGNDTKSLPISDYKDRHIDLWRQHCEQWKKLWCAVHRNRLSIESGQWAVAEGLLRRYVCLSEIKEGLGNLDCAYDVQIDWLNPPSLTKNAANRLILKRTGKVELVFRGTLGKRQIQQWSAYKHRKTWTLLPSILLSFCR